MVSVWRWRRSVCQSVCRTSPIGAQFDRVAQSSLRHFLFSLQTSRFSATPHSLVGRRLLCRRPFGVPGVNAAFWICPLTEGDSSQFIEAVVRYDLCSLLLYSSCRSIRVLAAQHKCWSRDATQCTTTRSVWCVDSCVEGAHKKRDEFEEHYLVVVSCIVVADVVVYTSRFFWTPRGALYTMCTHSRLSLSKECNVCECFHAVT